MKIYVHIYSYETGMLMVRAVGLGRLGTASTHSCTDTHTHKHIYTQTRKHIYTHN